ncbi:hypothetical protein AAF712_010848 [Marasmius tenuissimus]|uniref:Cytochrome P450 n=1 Tax=Marasmius tenuissimus TaxID=585030 RepID=A0ABR2ZMS0_9AGAR
MHSALPISLVAVIVFLILRRLTGASRRVPSLPPGPKGLPLIGNLRDIANQQNLLWETYTQWAQRYGDVFHLDVFGAHTIVLNSHEAITELLEKRSQNYSDRPEMPMLHDLVGGKWQIAFMRYSDSWRLHRKTFHQSFQPSILSEYHEIQRNEATSLMEKLTASPQDLIEHVNQ